MLNVHIDTLAALNRERHAELVEEAQTQRLLRAQRKASDSDRRAGTTAPARTTTSDVLRRSGLTALPARIREAMSH
jgi:hypothetical protein